MVDKKDVLEIIKQYFVDKRKNEIWRPGEDLVHYSGPYFDHNEYVAAVAVLLDEWLVHSDKCKKFENVFPSHLGKKYGVMVNSGSSANFLMFAALSSDGQFGTKFKLPKGSKILTPVTCFPTTVSPIISCGFVPIFCDVEIPSLNPNLDEIEFILKHHKENESKPIRVFIYAPVMGNPLDMECLMSLMEEYDCMLLEDTCDALGGTYDDKKLGSFGLMSTVSMYVAHHMSSGGEGGFIATDNPQLLRLLDSQRSWGRGCHCSCPITNNDFDASTGGTACQNRFSCWLTDDAKDVVYDHRYVFTELGFNLKPLELQGAIALEQLKKLDIMEAARRDNFSKLNEIFLKYSDYFHLPVATPKSDPCWFGYLMTIKEDAPFSREEFTQFLEKNLIQTRTYFTGNILYHKGYNHLAKGYGSLKERFPVADLATRNSLFLGTYIGLTQEKIDYISEQVDNFFKQLKEEHEGSDI
jgi:CDP-6-deoxy-D-xylo-4-hexulose-3-dehydrase